LSVIRYGTREGICGYSSLSQSALLQAACAALPGDSLPPANRLKLTKRECSAGAGWGRL